MITWFIVSFRCCTYDWKAQFWFNEIFENCCQFSSV